MTHVPVRVTDAMLVTSIGWDAYSSNALRRLEYHIHPIIAGLPSRGGEGAASP